ncbi:MAG: hypothetical protein J6Y54_07470, partial [Lentisphaeria bacterium]|nr:hypothetical protein [Lentisphaeria bacterium]
GSAFSIAGPVVDTFEANNGVTLVVNSGASAGNVTVNAGATVAVSSGGKVGSAVVNGVVNLAAGGSITDGITVENGGKFNLNGGTIYNMTVKAGGSASAAVTGLGYHGVTVEAGGYLRTRTATYYGTFLAASGTLDGDLKATSDSVDGVFCGGSQTVGAMHWHGTLMSNYVINGAAYCYLSNGASVRNGSALAVGGGFAFGLGGGYIYNAQITNGSIWMNNSGNGGVVSLGGAETNITKGNWYHCNCAGATNRDANLYAENGVLYDAVIKKSGNWLKELTVLEGLTVSRAVMSSGGSLTLVSGGIGNELTVSGYGRLYISSGGVATSAHGKGGMYVYDGGIINSTTVESTGALYVSNGGVANDIAVDSGAKFYVSAGGKVNGLVVSTGELNADHAVFTGTAEGTDISIYGGKNSGQYCVKVSGGAVVSKVYQSGGGLWVYNNGTVKDLEVVKGAMVFQDNTYGSDVKVSGGTTILYVRNNALVENLHMSGAEARFDAGTVRNAVFEGTIGQLKVGKNFLMESASFDKGAVVSVTSGGRLDSATVNNGAQLQVSKGGEVTNLVLNGGANANRIRLYDGGHISGATISGTAGDRNYISALTGSGLIEDVTADKAGIYLASGGIIRNVTQKNGAYVILRGENPYASGANVLGGTLYFQNGAKGENIVVNGGNMQVVDDAYAVEVKGSGAKVSGADLVKGNIFVSAGGKLFDLRASGGSVTVKSTGTTYGDPLLSGAVFTGGVLTLSGGAVAKNIKLDGGGAIYGENATLEDFDIEAPTVTGKKLAISGAAMIASGGRINGKDKVGIMDLTGGAKFNEAYVSGGSVFLSANAEITNVELTGGAVILRGEETYVSGATVLGGTLHIQNGGKGDDITIAGGALSVTDTNMTNPAGKTEIVNDVTMTAGTITVSSGGTINRLAAEGGTINVNSAGVVNTVDVAGGKLMVFGNGTANDVTVGENGSAIVSGTLNVATSAWNVQVNNGGVVSLDANETLGNAKTVAGAHVNYKENKSGATIKGAETNIAASTFYYNGATVANGFSVENGVVRDLGADGNVYRIGIGDGITVEDAEVFANCRISAFGGAVVSGVNIVATTTSASVIMRDDSEVYNANLTGGSYKAVINLYENAKASGVTINAGGKVGVSAATVSIEDTTVKAGGELVLIADADTGKKLTLDVADGNSIAINNLGLVNDSTTIMLVGETAGNTYTIATTGSTDKYVNCGEWGLYDDSIKANETITNAFTSMTYEFKENGRQIEVTAFEAATQEAAGSIEGGTTINTNGKAAKWTQNTTTTSGSVIKAATSAIAGDAWLELDGANLAGTTLYGAETGFTGGVNLYALNDAVVNNLAAGAEAGGTVESVKLTIEDATVGLAYAGGFGNVTSKTETLISGATVLKDFYAGALANYAKTGTVTHTGDITLEIADGEFSGNIYGAASVKAGAATSLVHSVGNVTITVKDGETKKGNQACLFAGGYATGSAASDSAVYTVGNVDVTISGGTWTSGATAGGRGVFGGIFASQVTAVAEDVTLTITGGTFGNVYGGGWAQKNGVSVVDDVEITIDGGTIANVFGGGTHSTSGGSTIVDDVSINISGGNITGAIYARGQLDGDVVSGDEVNVTFTGDTNFGCGVFGYSYVGGAASDAVLSYTAYTGTFSGAIGGFDSIVFDDDTAMTLSTAAADVSNGKWEFDFTDRAAELAGTSFLTWSTADFAGDTVKVNFTDAAQAAAGWNIATAAFTGASFDLYIGGTEITSVAYDTAIADGDWAGWKFTDENGTLKFKQLA